MKIQCGIEVAMDLGVCQLRHFSISFLSSLLGTESGAVRLDSSSSSGASVVAIDNKIEQAMVLSESTSGPASSPDPRWWSIFSNPGVSETLARAENQDLVKSHLMYAVREEVEVLKEQIKELIEKNSQLEQENSLLKTLASPEQMAQFQAQLQTGSSPASTQPPAPPASGPPGTA